MDQMLTFKQFKEQSSVTILPLREKFFRGLVFNVGQIVEDIKGVYEILDRGTNYVTVCNEGGELSKKFIDAIQVSEQTALEHNEAQFGFKGFAPKHLSEEAKTAFRDVFSAYEGGSITDAVAILKSLKAVDGLFEEFSQEQLDIAQSSLSRIGVWESHQEYLNCLTKEIDESKQYKSTDKLKIAGVIADTLGASSAGSNPELIVNNALRVARKTGLSSNQESMKIINRMLELAKSVGIDYDAKIFSKKPEVKTTTESYSAGNPVKITHDDGRVMYGMVSGIHGSVIAVKHGNNRITYNHNYKIQKHTGKNVKPDAKTFSDIAHLGKAQTNVPDDIEAKQASSMSASDETNRLMIAKKLQSL